MAGRESWLYWGPDQVAPEPKDGKQGKQSAARPYQQNPPRSTQVLSCCLLLLLIGRGEGWKTPIYSNKAWHQTSLSHGSLVRAQQDPGLVLGFKCCWVLLFYLLKLPEIFSSVAATATWTSPNCHRALGKKAQKYNFPLSQKNSPPRSRCKSWRCGPRPWIYPLCWQPLIEPRLIGLMDDLEIEVFSSWGGAFQSGKICSHVLQWLQCLLWGKCGANEQ